jgi:hypothetical protein
VGGVGRAIGLIFKILKGSLKKMATMTVEAHKVVFLEDVWSGVDLRPVLPGLQPWSWPTKNRSL